MFPLYCTRFMRVIEVRLQSKRRERALTLQKLQHVVPAGALFYHGLSGMMADESTALLALALVEVLSSGLVIGAFARSLRHKLRPAAHAAAHHGVDWVDIFLGGMLITEAISHWHHTQHWQRPTLLLAVTTIGFGIFHGRLMHRQETRRALRISDDGVTVGGRFFTRFTATWPEIDRIEISETLARIVTRAGGERRFNLTDLQNPAELIAGLQAAQRQWLPSPGAR